VGEPRPERLASRSSAGALIGGLLAGLEHALANRPPTPAQIEERYHRPWAALNGVVVEGLEERVERPEPADRSGAKV
jgi:hypothetical protein